MGHSVWHSVNWYPLIRSDKLWSALGACQDVGHPCQHTGNHKTQRSFLCNPYSLFFVQWQKFLFQYGYLRTTLSLFAMQSCCLAASLGLQRTRGIVPSLNFFHNRLCLFTSLSHVKPHGRDHRWVWTLILPSSMSIRTEEAAKLTSLLGAISAAEAPLHLTSVKFLPGLLF